MDRTCAFRELLLLSLTVGIGLAQQSQLTPRRLPAPIWPGEAAASVETKQGVYYDLADAQALIVTRDSSGTVTGEIRRDVPNQAKPAVSFLVQQSQGHLLYTYLLSDVPSAKQRTKSVSVLVPNHDSGIIAGGWPANFSPTTLSDHSATVSMATMRKLTWEDQSSSPAPVQNLQLTLRSDYLPGFGDLDVQGLVQNPITSADFLALSSDTASQLGAFLEPGLGNTSYSVLLPLFRQDTSKLRIASNYLYAVSVLSRKGLLNSSSTYVTQLASSLQQFLEGSGAVGFQAVGAKPSTPIEQAVQGAVSIALQ